MHYEKHRGRINERTLRKYRVGAVFLAAAILLLTVSAQFRRIISDAAAIQAQNAFSDSASAAVMEAASDGYSFDVVSVCTGSDGQVVSIQSDTGRINQLKAQLTQSLLAELEQRGSQAMKVSLGTLTGLEVLSGRGPAVELRMELRGGINTEITSEFYEAGINQTLHRISCTMSADYYIILPGCRFATTLITSVPLAESVIVGAVPDAFTYVVGDENDTVGRIFDYGHLE